MQFVKQFASRIDKTQHLFIQFETNITKGYYKMKRGRPEEIERKSVYLGKRGNSIRTLVAEYSKIHGDKAFSRLVRNLLMFFFLTDPAYEKMKTRLLIGKRKEILGRMNKIHDEWREINEELTERGVDTDRISEA